MKIVVCVKQTPDTAELPKVDLARAKSGELGVTMVVNPWDEFALEEGIRLSERFKGDVTAVSIGPAQAIEALRTAIAMGIANAVLLTDGAFKDGDAWATARVLAGAIKKSGAADVVITGKQAVDGNSGLVSVGLSRLLGASYLSGVTKVVDISGGKITVERGMEEGKETVTATLPAVISVAREINEPRYPSFMGIRKASKATVPTWAAGDLGLSAGQVGKAGSVMDWVDMRKPPARATKCEIIKADTVEQQASILMDRLLADKVL